MFWISFAGSVFLIAGGIFFIFDHVAAAKAFGVPLSGGGDNAYLSVAAVRDVAFGGLTLAFALLRDRRAVGLCLLLGAIIPLGDGMVVLENSPTPWQFLPVHWGGAAACLGLAFVLLRIPGGRPVKASKQGAP
jgi:hypothetical protein